MLKITFLYGTYNFIYLSFMGIKNLNIPNIIMRVPCTHSFTLQKYYAITFHTLASKYLLSKISSENLQINHSENKIQIIFLINNRMHPLLHITNISKYLLTLIRLLIFLFQLLFY